VFQALVQWELLSELVYACAQALSIGILAIDKRGANDVCNLGECCCIQTTGGQCRRTDAQAGGNHWRAWVVRNRVAVDRDTNLVQQVFCLLAIHFRVAQVNEHQVHIGATGKYVNASCLCLRSSQTLSKNLRPLQGTYLTLTRSEEHTSELQSRFDLVFRLLLGKKK